MTTPEERALADADDSDRFERLSRPPRLADIDALTERAEALIGVCRSALGETKVRDV